MSGLDHYQCLKLPLSIVYGYEHMYYEEKGVEMVLVHHHPGDRDVAAATMRVLTIDEDGTT